MRFVTFLGMIIIAKSINPNSISDFAEIIVIVLLASIVIDIIELSKKWSKAKNKN